MTRTLLILLSFLLLLFSCHKDADDEIVVIDGSYVGTFQRNSEISEVTLDIVYGEFSGQSATDNFPAICNGTFQISNTTINFKNECVFPSTIDGTLILNGTWNYSFFNSNLTLENSIGDKYTLHKP